MGGAIKPVKPKLIDSGIAFAFAFAFEGPIANQ